MEIKKLIKRYIRILNEYPHLYYNERKKDIFLFPVFSDKYIQLLGSEKSIICSSYDMDEGYYEMILMQLRTDLFRTSSKINYVKDLKLFINNIPDVFDNVKLDKEVIEYCNQIAKIETTENTYSIKQNIARIKNILKEYRDRYNFLIRVKLLSDIDLQIQNSIPSPPLDNNDDEEIDSFNLDPKLKPLSMIWNNTDLKTMVSMYNRIKNEINTKEDVKNLCYLLYINKWLILPKARAYIALARIFLPLFGKSVDPKNDGSDFNVERKGKSNNFRPHLYTFLSITENPSPKNSIV